ncbi:hypothetical protein [Empedobacter sp. UBA7248]|uniref:hypothetical protein n=1 Tax=Empedobacter sp. UBA7248 TaxID=1946448 RepID=UPI0025BDB069|nr:hypothetical protein [Empedobacter sp. UBA7248]
MKLLYILMLFPFLSCSAQNKLKIETILAAPARVTAQNTETGIIYSQSRYVTQTARLEHAILMQNQSDNKLIFQLQGNISSGGLSINKVKKIRFEKAEPIGDSITLKYFLEIVNIAGKEGATVQGYNYSKMQSHTIPKNAKVIKIELYEDRITQRTGSKLPKLKLVAEKSFDLSTKKNITNPN